MKKIVFTPNAKQEAFFHAQTRYVAYGGARGGGKSWAMRMKLILLGAPGAGKGTQAEILSAGRLASCARTTSCR